MRSLKLQGDPENTQEVRREISQPGQRVLSGYSRKDFFEHHECTRHRLEELLVELGEAID
jgi:hypothetical protein